MQFYETQIAGITRRLPLCPIGNGMQIAAFVLFGDVEITRACATELLKLAPEFDVLITNEAKGIPLAYEMARVSEKPYCVARKVKKLYMPESITVEVKSITTVAKQTLSIGSNEVEIIKGKRILLVDDVVSTGGSLSALEELVLLAGGNIVGCAAVLSEGSAKDRDGLICLGHLPLFDSEGKPVS